MFAGRSLPGGEFKRDSPKEAAHRRVDNVKKVIKIEYHLLWAEQRFIKKWDHHPTEDEILEATNDDGLPEMFKVGHYEVHKVYSVTDD